MTKLYNVIALGVTACFFLFSLACLSHDGNAQTQTTALSVCDVFNDLGRFSSKVITVHGELSITRHDVAIFSGACRGTVKAGGHEWPIGIHLGRGPTQSMDEDNRRSVEFLNGLLGLLINTYVLPDPITVPPFNISATFAGTLQSRTIDDLAAHGPAGFGDQGFFLAEIEAVAVRDLTVTGECVRARSNNSSLPSAWLYAGFFTLIQCRDGLSVTL